MPGPRIIIAGATGYIGTRLLRYLPGERIAGVITRRQLPALPGVKWLIGPSGIDFWPVWVAGSLGAACGDWLSYWVGLKLEHRVAHIWPLSSHPEMIPRGEIFMKKWGMPGIFIGRFFGPLRAVVPLIAGIFEMPYWRFQFANFTSAFVWAATLLTIGDVISTALQWVLR